MDDLRDYDYAMLDKLFAVAEQKAEEALKPIQLREIVPIEQWLENEYYVGPDGARLYDFWKDELKDIFGDHSGQYNEIIMETALGCRPIGERYWTDKGYLSLTEIRDRLSEGVYIKSDDGVRRIVGTVFRGQSNCRRVEFSNGYRFTGSEDHRIRVFIDGVVRWKKFSELQVGDLVVYSELPSLHGEGNYPLDKAYLAGYIYGDGGLTIDRASGKGIVYVQWSQNQSNSDEIASLVKKYLADSIESHSRNGWNYFYARKWDCHTFDEWHLGTCSSKRIPDWLFSSKREVICSFLTGLMDSDGTASGGNFEISLKNEVLIEQVQELFASLGIYTKIKRYSTKTRLHVTGKTSTKRLYKYCTPHIDYKREQLYRRATVEYSSNERTILKGLSKRMSYRHLHEERCKLGEKNKKWGSWRTGKQEITRECLEKVREAVPDWVSSDEELVYLLRNKVRLVEVVDIRDVGLLDVGDIQVQGSHTYQHCGIVSHNCGKTTIGNYILLRKLYEMSCFKNVPALYDLMSTATIVFMYFTISRQQAEIAGYAQFRETVDSIPYFKEQFPRDPSISSVLRFPEKVMMLSGSSTGHQIGLNLIATILDEANFFSQGKVADKEALNAVTTLHSSVINRGLSRFTSNGVNNSLSILISSPNYSSSYTQQRIQQAVGNPHTKVIKARLWDVKPHGTYSDDRFFVFVGSDKLDPCVVEDKPSLDNVLSTENIETDPQDSIAQSINKLKPEIKSLFDSVPVDFVESYRKNVVQALQDISSFSTSPLGRLFSSRVLLFNCVTEDLPNLFSKTELVISTQDNSKANNITHYMLRGLIHPEIPRYVHIDQSVTTDSTGLAMAHRCGYVERDGQKLPIIALDWALRVDPPRPPKKISISRIRSFIIFLKKVKGIPIQLCTYDQFASAESQQVLNENGIPSQHLSVDRTDEQYLAVLDLIYEGRLKAPRQVIELMATEIFDLIHYRSRKKVDHPDDGRKDVMDGVVGAVWNALTASPVEEKRTGDSKLLARLNSEDDEDQEQQLVEEFVLNGYLQDLGLMK